MNARELHAIEEPVTAVAPEEVPADLADRARAYNAAVETFHETVRAALRALERGIPVEGEAAEGLRAAATGLVTARDGLLGLARLPHAARLARP